MRRPDSRRRKPAGGAAGNFRGGGNGMDLLKKYYRHAVPIAVIALFVAACSELTKNPVAPATPEGPAYSATEPFNDTGACLAKDAYLSGFTSGVNDSLDLADPKQNCTSNDIRIARADVKQYSLNGTDFITFTGQPIACNAGQTILVTMDAILQETATSERTDIGIWIATDGGNARTGTCNHYNLVNGGAAGVSNIDSDQCGDMNNADSTRVALGTLSFICNSAGTSDSLHIGSCLGWTQPGGDQVCPTANSPQGFRNGTVPGTTSKCNCGGFNLPIIVNRTAQLEVRKVCAPTTDAGTFDLLIDGSNQFANNVACGGSTSAQTLSAGTSASPGAVHTFGEGDFTTANYTTTFACVNRAGGSHAPASGTSLGPNNITLLPNEDVICTYTNTRNPGKIELKKALSPTTDPGLFNLFIKSGATTVGSASNVGNGGTTGAGGTSLAPGTYNLSETAGTATLLTDYTTTGPACVNRVGGGSVTVTSGNVTIASNDDIICTITNTRNTGKIELVKALNPTNDPGLFNLFIKVGSGAGATAASASNVGNGGTTGAGGSTLNTGTYNLSETAGTATSLGDYGVSGPVCVNRVGGGSVTVTSGNVVLANGADIICTITNTRNPGKLELIKALSPTSDPGLFNLFIKVGTSSGSTAASASNVGNGGTTGAGGTSLAPGNYHLSETAGTATVLTDYTVTGPVCVNRVGGGSVTVTSGVVTLASNADVVCTITNTRNPGKIELRKATVPTDDTGKFNLFIRLNSGAGAIQASATDVGNGGTTGAGGTTLPVGNYHLSEAAGTGTSLDDYVASAPSCVNRVGGGSVTVTSGVVALASNADIICTITNSKKAKLIVQKVVTGGGTQSFDFTTGPAPGAASFSLTNGGSHDSGFTLTPGTYKVCELNLAVLWGATATVNGSPATLYNPDAAIPEDNGNRCTDVTVAYGSTTTVVFTNTPQQNGETRTIGYWKNWSSCTKGMQYIKANAPGGAGAEATLDFYLGGAGVQSIYPIGSITTLTCQQAVSLLSKSSIDGTKRPGDPIYNMVAQLLGAKLNIAAGAGTCPTLDQALIDAQNLLVAISFDGTKSYTGKNPTGTATALQLSTATTLAGILGAYNQGDLTGVGCPAHV